MFSLSKLSIACTVALGALTLCLAPGAQAAPPAHAAAAANPDADEPDTTGSTTIDFNCELGNKITIYSNADDDHHIALRWKKRLHRLTRVGTSTGANRFENRLFGLIWIGIPAKGMLLDSKQNRQLANECKNAEQARSATTLTPAGGQG
jgi:hypothetical protein